MLFHVFMSHSYVFFDEMCAKLVASDKKYWDAIGWDNGFKRFVSQHYHSCRTSLFLSKVYNKILSYKYK